MKKKLVKRGLSPVIATVMLIGIVVVIGLIVFTWFKGFTQEAVTKFDQNAQLVCGEIEFQASLSGGIISITNSGNVPIYRLLIKTSSISGTGTRDLKELTSWPDEGLNVGGAFGPANIGSQSGDVVLIPVLRGSSQSGGEASYICDEDRYGYRIS
jgi:flagellin-like protein